MMDFYLKTCMRFLIKLDMASQPLYCLRGIYTSVAPRVSFGNNGTYIYCVLEWK